MKRSIKFRGKRIDNGKWVTGCLTRYSKEISYITVDLIKNEVYRVFTKTVGQFTGLKDKNNKYIYEGDILRYYYKSVMSARYEIKRFFEVVFKEGRFSQYEFGDYRKNVDIWHSWHSLEIVGNKSTHKIIKTRLLNK